MNPINMHCRKYYYTNVIMANIFRQLSLCLSREKMTVRPALPS